LREVRSVAERKEFLTAAEVMERLRLGRTTVYQQARLFLATGGTEGIPCRRYGRSLRFPAAELDAMVSEPRALPPRAAKVIDIAEARQYAPTQPTDPPPRPTRPSPRRTRRRRDDDQPTLPLTS
jgi:Helix-turn-helix domain